MIMHYVTKTGLELYEMMWKNVNDEGEKICLYKSTDCYMCLYIERYLENREMYSKLLELAGDKVEDFALFIFPLLKGK
jgi:hypothetical protein